MPTKLLNCKHASKHVVMKDVKCLVTNVGQRTNVAQIFSLGLDSLRGSARLFSLFLVRDEANTRFFYFMSVLRSYQLIDLLIKTFSYESKHLKSSP